MNIGQLQKEFKNIFNKNADHVWFCPGRVNLIGEHIDYNGGLVMPCAITFGTYLLASPNNEGIFHFRSTNFEQQADIPLRSGYLKEGESWFNYPLGVIDYFLRQGYQHQGLNMLFHGDVPIGSGLSSSASIEVVTAFALNQLVNSPLSKLDIAKLARSVENHFIGVNCGIMDQFAVTFGEKDKALMLTCDTLAYQAVDTHLGDFILAIINTNKPRKLAESKYNERVLECTEALNALKQEIEINYLCDINSLEFLQHQHLIKNLTVRNRTKHVIEENERVKLAAEVLSNHDLIKFGQLMYASHDSLRELYGVSGKELDTIVDYCRTNPHVAGARMTGAGFGGCAIALVKADEFDQFEASIMQYYYKNIGYWPAVYRSQIGNGVMRLL
jgi:galactokinase